MRIDTARTIAKLQYLISEVAPKPISRQELAAKSGLTYGYVCKMLTKYPQFFEADEMLNGGVRNKELISVDSGYDPANELTGVSPLDRIANILADISSTLKDRPVDKVSTTTIPVDNNKPTSTGKPASTGKISKKAQTIATLRSRADKAAKQMMIDKKMTPKEFWQNRNGWAFRLLKDISIGDTLLLLTVLEYELGKLDPDVSLTDKIKPKDNA